MNFITSVLEVREDDSISAKLSQVKRFIRSTLPVNTTLFRLVKVYTLVFDYIIKEYPDFAHALGLVIVPEYFGPVSAVKEKDRIIPIYSLVKDPAYFILKKSDHETVVIPKHSLEDYFDDEFILEIRSKVDKLLKHSTKDLIIQNIKQFGLRTLCDPLIKEAVKKIEECTTYSHEGHALDLVSNLKTARELLGYVNSKLHLAEEAGIDGNFIDVRADREAIMGCINILYKRLGKPSYFERYVQRLEELSLKMPELKNRIEILYGLSENYSLSPDKFDHTDNFLRCASAVSALLTKLPRKVEESISCNYDDNFLLFDEFTKYTTEKGDVLRELECIVEKDFSILDIGAGTGSLTIPLAKMTKRVVALDPSEQALSYMQKRAVQQGVNNITYWRGKWEEIKNTRKFDLVLCIHTLYFIEDWSASIRKMLQAAKKYVVLITHSNSCEFTHFLRTFWPKIKGCNYPDFHDYTYAYQLLEDMGTSPSVKEIISKLSIPSVQDALHISRFFFETSSLNPDVEEELKAYFRNRAVNGKINFEVTNAMITVRKDSALNSNTRKCP